LSSAFATWLSNPDAILATIFGVAFLVFGLFLLIDWILVHRRMNKKAKVDSSTYRRSYWEGIAQDSKAPAELRAQARSLLKQWDTKTN